MVGVFFVFCFFFGYVNLSVAFCYFPRFIVEARVTIIVYF
ncbi:protein of unknown function [Burkholderia multivorans]